MWKLFQITALTRFYLLKVMFKKSGVINYIYYKAGFIRLKRIQIGSSNIFQEYSTVCVNSYSNNQNISIGNSNTFARFSILKSHGGYIKIGDGNLIGEKVQIQGRGGVVIGSRCMIAANTFISSSNHDFHDPFSDNYLRKEVPAKTQINDFVWIGANSVIIAGVNIGHHSIVAAGTIVTKDIESYSIVAGNPGVIIKKFSLDKREWVRV